MDFYFKTTLLLFFIASVKGQGTQLDLGVVTEFYMDFAGVKTFYVDQLDTIGWLEFNIVVKNASYFFGANIKGYSDIPNSDTFLYSMPTNETKLTVTSICTTRYFLEYSSFSPSTVQIVVNSVSNNIPLNGTTVQFNSEGLYFLSFPTVTRMKNIWKFTNSIQCNNISILVNGNDLLSKMYVSPSCTCSLPTSEWQDLSSGATYMQVNMKCIDTGEYFLHLLPEYGDFNYSISAIQGAASQVPCGNCLNSGKCFNGNCYCQNPYSGSSCSTISGIQGTIPFTGSFPPYSINYLTFTSSYTEAFQINFYRFYDNSFKLSVNEPPIYKDRLLWNIDPVFVFFESTVSRTICKHFASGTFILRIENWKASPTVPITVNTTAVNQVINSTGTINYNSISNAGIFRIPYSIWTNNLRNLTFSIFGNLNSIYAAALVDEDICGIVARDRTTFLYPKDYSQYSGAIDYQQKQTSWTDLVLSKLNYYVDFSSAQPIPGKDYYLVVLGYNFTIEVNTMKPSCPNDCNSNGVCKSDGTCSCYGGWSGTSCNVPIGTLLLMNQTSTFVMSSYDSLNFYFYSLQDSLFSVKLTSSSTPPTFSMSYKYQTPIYGSFPYSCTQTKTNGYWFIQATNPYGSPTSFDIAVITGNRIEFSILRMDRSWIFSQWPTGNIQLNGYWKIVQDRDGEDDVASFSITAPIAGAVTLSFTKGKCYDSFNQLPFLRQDNNIVGTIPACSPGTYFLTLSPSYGAVQISVRINRQKATATCPGCCSGNGFCNNGVCDCLPSWSGPTCSIPTCRPFENQTNSYCSTRSVALSPKSLDAFPTWNTLNSQCSDSTLYNYIDQYIKQDQLATLSCTNFDQFLCKSYFMPCQVPQYPTIPCTCSSDECISSLYNCTEHNDAISSYQQIGLPIQCEETFQYTTGSTTGTQSGQVTSTGAMITSDLQTSGENSPSNRNWIIVGASAGGVVLLIIVIAAAIAILRRKKKPKENREVDLVTIAMPTSSFGNFKINYEDIKIGKQVGKGSSGIVFKGIYKHSEVAIKKVETKEVSQVLESFISEAEIMKNVPPHPNVVLFRGITLPPDPVCIVTEYCDGGSLLEYIKKNVGNISNEKMISLAIDIARGMFHLHTGIHDKEVIHRDLAARNVLLKKDGSAAVSDFGLARVKSSDDISKTTSEIGPLRWMAPESAKDKIYSTKSDVFSYGVVLYEICTQSTPWAGLSGVQAVTKVIEGERMEIPLSVPPLLADLIRRCWNHDPRKRPDFEKILDILQPNLSIGKTESKEEKPRELEVKETRYTALPGLETETNYKPMQPNIFE